MRLIENYIRALDSIVLIESSYNQMRSIVSFTRVDQWGVGGRCIGFAVDVGSMRSKSDCAGSSPEGCHEFRTALSCSKQRA